MTPSDFFQRTQLIEETLSLPSANSTATMLNTMNKFLRCTKESLASVVLRKVVQYQKQLGTSSIYRSRLRKSRTVARKAAPLSTRSWITLTTATLKTRSKAKTRRVPAHQKSTRTKSQRRSRSFVCSYDQSNTARTMSSRYVSSLPLVVCAK